MNHHAWMQLDRLLKVNVGLSDARGLEYGM